MKYHTGCSGYNYKTWKGLFYPDELPQKEWLSYYASYFSTVEINRTFYSLPEDKDLEKWYKQTPADFSFTIKGSRYITHMKKLNIDQQSMNNLFDKAALLKEKAANILWQLPGNLHRKDEKLETFCQHLSTDFNHVIEFRHESWLHDDIMAILERHGVHFCITSSPLFNESFFKITGPVLYIRFHGKNDWYNYNYKKTELSEWAEKIKSVQNVKEGYFYFNNDQHAYGPFNGQQLKELLK